MASAKPPFRADHVGSILRSAPLKDARAKREKGEITAAQLKAVEDTEIKKIIGKQEEIGLQLVDRRRIPPLLVAFRFSRRARRGRGLHEPTTASSSPGVETKPRGVRVAGKVHLQAASLRRAFQVREGKHQGHAEDDHSGAVGAALPRRPQGHLERRLSGPRRILRDLGQAYKDVVKAFYDAGCRYLQFDDTVWAYLCSQKELELARQRGDDPTRLPEIYAKVINAAIKDRPSDMVITTHVCRGNFRSTWISEGGYEPVAEVMFGKTDYDGYFLEYDTERAGGFEPLRFVPKGKKQVVLGLITSKSGTLEKKDDVKKRIDEATKYVALDQLCLSPQCGFASTEEGNVLTEEAQWAKLKMIVDLSREVWG